MRGTGDEAGSEREGPGARENMAPGYVSENRSSRCQKRSPGKGEVS